MNEQVSRRVVDRHCEVAKTKWDVVDPKTLSLIQQGTHEVKIMTDQVHWQHCQPGALHQLAAETSAAVDSRRLRRYTVPCIMGVMVIGVFGGLSLLSRL